MCCVDLFLLLCWFCVCARLSVCFPFFGFLGSGENDKVRLVIANCGHQVSGLGCQVLTLLADKHSGSANTEPLATVAKMSPQKAKFERFRGLALEAASKKGVAFVHGGTSPCIYIT